MTKFERCLLKKNAEKPYKVHPILVDVSDEEELEKQLGTLFDHYTKFVAKADELTFCHLDCPSSERHCVGTNGECSTEDSLTAKNFQHTGSYFNQIDGNVLPPKYDCLRAKPFNNFVTKKVYIIYRLLQYTYVLYLVE